MVMEVSVLKDLLFYCVCNKFVCSITRNWPEISSLSLTGT